VTLWILGAGLFAAGLSHFLAPVRQLDQALARSLQEIIQRPGLVRFFQEIWLFGRTYFVLVVLGLLITLDPRKGLFGLLVYGATAGAERLIKLAAGRQRPFVQDRRIKMHQYREPDDPSFPSGDSLRAWFLAVIVPAALGFPPAGQILLAGLAGLVALGRIVLGVHYPTDVLSGTGLGLLGAALTLWGWHVIPWL
jgi:undecaprenyl-diphosphatase